MIAADVFFMGALPTSLVVMVWAIFNYMGCRDMWRPMVAMVWLVAVCAACLVGGVIEVLLW